MPSPIGHALGGLAVGCLLSRRREMPGSHVPSALVFAGLAVMPDLDLLVGAHSTYTHSIGAASLVTLIAFAAAGLRLEASVWALACGAAYASHILLDWLSHDTSPPVGIMALWPFTSAYYESSLHWLMPVSRRYWLAGFWKHNLTVILREVFLLGPPAAFVWWWRRA